MKKSEAIVQSATWREDGSIVTKSAAAAHGGSLEELAIAAEMAGKMAEGHAQGQALYFAARELGAYRTLCEKQLESEAKRLLYGK